MSRQMSLIFMIVLASILMIFYAMAKNAKEEYHTSAKNLVQFEEGAKKIYKLKRKFSKDQNERIIKSLLQIAPASKDYQRSGNRVVLFENLSVSTLASLIRRVENSTLKIKELAITRLSKDSATLKLEIAK